MLTWLKQQAWVVALSAMQWGAWTSLTLLVALAFETPYVYMLSAVFFLYIFNLNSIKEIR